MEQREWEPLTRAKLVGFVAGVGLFLLLVLRSEPGFIFLLDHANLLFHEAGHPVVGLLSSGLEPYGGTLGQLAFPCVLAVASKAYIEALTNEQQDVCIAPGAKRRTRPRLGQSGQQTGEQYWVGKECKKKPPSLALKTRKPKV